MSAQAWHRLRGHNIATRRKNYSGVDYYGEWGISRKVASCSCGESWTLVPENLPLSTKWRWV